MTVTVRTPILSVYVDNREVTNRFSARVSVGYDQRISEATVQCPTLPSWAANWSLVEIWMGADSTTWYPRFKGYLVEIDYALWPRAVQLICRGPLIKAEQTQCSTIGGIDMAGAGATDEDLVFLPSTGILARCGLVGSDGYGIDDFGIVTGGTGRTLGTTNGQKFYWNEGESGLAYIERLDQVSICPDPSNAGHWAAYRTYDTLAGQITRDPIVSTVPDATAAYTFTEGVDIFSGSAQQTVLPIVNRAQVTGYNAGTAAVTATLSQTNPNIASATGYITEQLSSELIEKSYAADAGDGIACDEVAAWMLQEKNRLQLYKITLTTPRADQIWPNQTISVQAPNRLGTEAAQKMWIQHVDCEIDEKGQFSQTLVCVGGLSSTASINRPPRADFGVKVDVENVVIGGSETALYTVYCTPASIALAGTITSYAWTATGGTPSSGTADDFSTTYQSITSTTITLTVTDSNGLSATLTKPVPTNARQHVARPLYLAGTTTIDDFTGQTWRQRNETGATVVANAPIWGASPAATTYYTGDDLATAPSSSSPFGSGTVTALWVETDVASSRVLAGGSAGGVAYSTNGGASWTACTSPDGNPVVRVIMSRFIAKQFFALTTAGLYRSDNLGSGWVTVLAAAGGETFRDVSISSPRFMIAMSGGRVLCDGAGTAQTFPSLSPAVSDVYAVVAQRSDTFCCYDATGRTFAHSASGGLALAQRTSLPGGTTPQQRGLWRDGAIWGVLYIAAGAAGCYKSVDAFRSAGGYYRVRQPGVGTSPASAVYTQIGADGLLVPGQAAIAAASIVTTAGQEKVYALGTEPSAWQQPSFDDSSWAASVAQTHPDTVTFVGPAATGAAWVTDVSGIVADGKTWLLRKSFSLGSGLITGATLAYNADDDVRGLWVNGIVVPTLDSAASRPSAARTVSIPPALLLPGGTNVIAVKIQNGSPGGGPSAFTCALSVS